MDKTQDSFFRQCIQCGKIYGCYQDGKKKYCYDCHSKPCPCDREDVSHGICEVCETQL
jgi:hypothetical protein